MLLASCSGIDHEPDLEDAVCEIGAGAPRSLEGLWKFHRGVFFDPRLSRAPYTAAELWSANSAISLQVPGIWDSVQAPRATGSYQLLIKNLQPGMIYTIQFKGINHQGLVWLDNRLLGTWADGGINFIPQSFYFEAISSSVLLTVSVENSYFTTGGIWLPVWFGEARAMDRQIHQGRFIDTILLGAVFMMGLYHFMLYLFRPRDRAPLFFGIFCLLSALKAGLSGEQIVALYLPWLSQDLAMRLAYVATIAMPLCFLAYMASIFPSSRNRWIVPTMATFGLVQGLISLIAPVYMVQSWFFPYQFAIILVSIHMVLVMVSAVKRRARGSVLMLLGFLVLFATAVNDILHDNKFVVTFFALNYGLFIFLFSQALILGGLFSSAFKQVQALNDSLEHKVAERTRELEVLAHHDPLTGLYNRRQFWALLHHGWKTWLHCKLDFCLVMIDLDFFKHINDRDGHGAGDEALRQTARILQSRLRHTDMVARYGGEEFCMILPGVNLADAQVIMEEIRTQLAAETPLTLSYGIALASNHVHPDKLLDAADRLMYRAKQGGRNRGVIEGNADRVVAGFS